LTIVKDIGIPIICVTELIKRQAAILKNENNEEILVKQ
jgi:hypothetical protein